MLRFSLYFLVFFITIFIVQVVQSPTLPPIIEQMMLFSAHKKTNTQRVYQPPEHTHTPRSTPASVPKKSTIDTRELTFRTSPSRLTYEKIWKYGILASTHSSYFNTKVLPMSVTLDGFRREPRGQFTNNTIILSSKIASFSEMIKVLTHEMAHKIDIYFLKKGRLTPDPSVRFYGISWESTIVKKPGTKNIDFVSGYAQTNKYEDFAESFVFYVFHNKEFEVRAHASEALQKKYDFFRKYIFTDDEFIRYTTEIQDIDAYVWDSTKISINIKKYLNLLKKTL